MWLLLFLLGIDVLISGGLEGLFEVARIFDSDRHLRSPAVIWFMILGLVGGLLTGLVVPGRLLSTGPFPGFSLLLVPLLLGSVMHGWGWYRSERDKNTSHLATWYGGGTLGLGLAAGRLIVLASSAT
jgi:uncharacterized membrane protein AbrB (regulator of aidB expression)